MAAREISTSERFEEQTLTLKRTQDTPVPTSGIHEGVVLVVDDDPDQRLLVTRWLERAGIKCLEASSGEAAMEVVAVHSDVIEAVVSDVMMDGMDGFELVKLLGHSPETSSIPIVMMTGTATGESDVLRGVENGAVDYLAKPISPQVMVAKLKVLTARMREERRLRRDLHSAQVSASLDALTGLYNRWALGTRLREETAFAARYGRPFSLVMLDLDHFKALNDTYGHEQGDRALVHVAEAIRSVLRGDDAAFRYGGEEFLLVLRGCDADHAAGVASRLRDRLDATPLMFGKDPPRALSFSGGIAVADAATGYASEHLVAQADAALYCAKRAGRNRVHRAA